MSLKDKPGYTINLSDKKYSEMGRGSYRELKVFYNYEEIGSGTIDGKTPIDKSVIYSEAMKIITKHKEDQKKFNDINSIVKDVESDLNRDDIE